MISIIKKKDKPKEEAKPIEKKTSRVNSIVLIPKKKNGREGLMFVDINIACQKQSALVDTRAPDLFISKKAAKKLGLSIRKSNKKIKMINFDEDLTIGVVRNVELQISEWKGKEDFEVGPKVLSSIQLVEDVSYGRNINSIERNATKAHSEKLVEHETDIMPVKSIVELPHLENVGCVSDFEGKEAMQKQSKRVNAASKIHCEHSDSVLNSDLLAWQGRTKSRYENQGDSNGNKSKLGQVRVETSCQQYVPTSATVQVKRRRKPRQKFQRRRQSDRKTSREEAKVTREFQGESSQCHSEVATRALREWVRENLTGQSVKPVTIAQNAPHGGLSIRWGSFSPRELARFQEPLEKPVRLKFGWPDNADMAT
ncbi:hypothetical protein Gogos_013837 [Gossypium gossypioides]|uniref:Uncharacterized protein n=1 Tax=Gossypium gossypioides TaxID=34282 RepID=A0A7J9BX45_GOSGO|nr:hypothetical protein [Gossypium gossypioides]